ncbi:MAG: hypothetical protein Q9163_000173 [Psora crenata]
MAGHNEIPTEIGKRRVSIITSPPGLTNEDDATVLAKFGYKEELRRNFTMIEVFGIAFSIMSPLPSIASTLLYSIPAGPIGMVWGWFLASALIFIVGLAMADLGSAIPTSGGLYWWTHFFSPPKMRNPLCFLVGYSNTLGLVGWLCSVDYGFALMLLSVIVIARDGNWTPSNYIIYGTFLTCVICHGILASVLSRIMGKLQSVSVVMNFILIFATIIALPIGAKDRPNDGRYIFAQMENLTSWPVGWTFMLAWLSPIWTIGAPFGILMSVGSGWFFGFIIMIVLAATINPDLSAITGSNFGQPMAQIYYDAIGKRGTLGLMTLLFIVQFLMGLSILVAVSRQTWAFSRDGALPFSSFFRHISKRFDYVPLRAIWGCVALAAILGLLSLIAKAAAQALFSLPVAALYVAWVIPIFARVVWGREKFKPGPFYTGDNFSVPIAWAAICFLVFGVLLAMFPLQGPDPTLHMRICTNIAPFKSPNQKFMGFRSLGNDKLAMELMIDIPWPADVMNYTAVVNSAVWFGALAYYFISARKWFTGPTTTLDTLDLTEQQQDAIRRHQGSQVEGSSKGRP